MRPSVALRCGLLRSRLLHGLCSRQRDSLGRHSATPLYSVVAAAASRARRSSLSALSNTSLATPLRAVSSCSSTGEEESSQASINGHSTHQTPTAGIDSAELLFELHNDSGSRHNDSSSRHSDSHHDSSSFSSSSSAGPVYTTDGTPRWTPQTEPESDADKAALQQRRQLFRCCNDLNDVVTAELHAEVARDMKDGAAAVPPLAPTGWRVVHATGSSYFTMTRRYAGSVHGSSDRARGSEAEEGNGGTAMPRFRSVHDIMTGRGGQGPSSPSSTSSARQHTDAHSSDSRSFYQLDKGREGRGSHQRPRIARSDTHVTIFAPFRTLDLSLYDPTLSISEWTRFDVLVRKTKPAGSPTLPITPLQGQQKIWDGEKCMFLRLACVNSELRIRSLQFVSGRLARALEEHAVFGQGEPPYLELRRRLRQERVIRRADGTDRWHTAVSPLHVFDSPDTNVQAASAAAPAAEVVAGAALPSATAGALMTQFDRAGEYARTFVYGGPYLTELSRELREALLEYVMVHLGVSNEVAEYVCQMQFFLEQEEYVGWLAQWGQLATTLRKTL